MKDYYRILGVSEQAAEKEIKAAYRKLAKRYHPDVVKDDPKKTQRMYEIQEAYECLGDEESRKKYDKTRMERRAGGHQTGKERSEKNVQCEQKSGQTGPDMSQFERFFGFQPGKGMETYQNKKSTARKPDGPMKPEEMFAAFFGRQNHKGDGR